MNILQNLSSICLIFIATASYAISPSQIRWHNETSDTTNITKLLTALGNAPSDPGIISTAIAKQLIGTPYGSKTIESQPEMLTLRLDSLDCTTFVENVAAAAITLHMGRNSWQDFAHSLMEIRYRGGAVNGYASRLHYISDWILDNAHRGNLQDVTDRIGKADYMVKTLDFMTQHRDKYPALENEENYNALKNAEIGYRSHRFPYIKTMNIKSASLKEGDIVAIVTSIKGLDVTHVGLITMVNGTPHLLHASSANARVEISPLPLYDYVKRNRSAVGIRVIRITP